MSDWDTLFLGVIAVATLLMAVLQVGAVVAAIRLAKRVERLADELNSEVKPLIARANAIAEEAQRAVALAVDQAERVDAVMSGLSRRVDETAGALQEALIRPAREGLAIMAGLKAGFEVLRGRRAAGQAGSGRFDEEDALFIG